MCSAYRLRALLLVCSHAASVHGCSVARPSYGVPELLVSHPVVARHFLARRRVVARPLGALALDGGGEGRLLVPVQLAGGVLCGGRGHDDERRRLGDLHRLRRMHGRQQA